MAAAWTRTSASPGPGRGVSSCSRTSPAGPPVDAMVARVRRPVGIAAPVEDLVHRVPEREDDRAPVVEGVVERENRRLLPAMLGLRRGERSRDLVDERSPLPQLSGEIEEH